MLCIDYWGVNSWPDCVYSFILTNETEVLTWRDSTGMSIAGDLNLSDKLLSWINEKEEFMMGGCELGLIGWLKYGLLKFEDCDFNRLFFCYCRRYVWNLPMSRLSLDCHSIMLLKEATYYVWSMPITMVVMYWSTHISELWEITLCEGRQE